MFRKLSVGLPLLALGLFVLSACVSGGTAAPVPTSKPVSEPTDAPQTESRTKTDEETIAEEPTVEVAEEPAEEVAEEVAEEPAEEPAEEVAGEAEEAMTVEPTVEPEAMAEETNAVRTFMIVPEESKASYIVDEEFLGGALDRLGISPGLVDTIGSTQEIEGELQLKLNDPSPLVLGHFVVNLQSLTSDQDRRDNQIRQRWLESNTYPLAEFTATGLEDAPQEYTEDEAVTFKVNGDMTIREITNPVTFDVTATLTGDAITGVTATQLKMTDFGFPPPSFGDVFDVADEFTVEVEFTFKEQ